MYVKYEDRYLKAKEITGRPSLHNVQSACVSPNGKRLTCITERAQLYWAPIYKRYGNKDEDGDSFYGDEYFVWKELLLLYCDFRKGFKT